MARLWDALHRFKEDWRLLGIILVADLGGMVFGWYYYWDVGQFDPSSVYFQHPLWWPLVADSPNAVLVFFAALVLYKLTGWRHKLLDAAAFTLNVYVGLWTVFLFVAYADRMGTFDWGGTNNILFFSHMGMPLQALVLVRDMRGDAWRWPGVAAMLAALAAFVWVDYWGPHIHPAPFLDAGGGADALHAVSPWLMVTAGVAWLLIVYVPRRAPQASEASGGAGEGRGGAGRPPVT